MRYLARFQGQKVAYGYFLPLGQDGLPKTILIGVRGSLERDIWSLRMGWGVAGKSMFLPSSPPPLAWTPQNVVLMVNDFSTIEV